jgi:hypothetical protein
MTLLVQKAIFYDVRKYNFYASFDTNWRDSLEVYYPVLYYRIDHSNLDSLERNNSY